LSRNATTGEADLQVTMHKKKRGVREEGWQKRFGAEKESGMHTTEAHAVRSVNERKFSDDVVVATI
jgi:hypothetical protein